MPILNLILMILAFVLLLLAAGGISHPRLNLAYLGLAFWALAIILGGIGGAPARP